MAELDAAGGARGGSTRLLAEDELDAAQLLEDLETKEEQLRLAASFGQTLLERQEELQEENSERESQVIALQAAMEEHEYRLKELSDNSSKLAEESLRKDRQLQEARQLQQEMEEKLAAAAAASTETTDLATAAAIQQELEAQKAQAAAEIDRLRHEAEEIKRREADTMARREKEETERIEAQKAKRELEKHMQNAEKIIKAQQDEITQARAAAEVERNRSAEQAQAAARTAQEMLNLQTKLAAVERQLAEERAANAVDQDGNGSNKCGVSKNLLDEINSPKRLHVPMISPPEGEPVRNVGAVLGTTKSAPGSDCEAATTIVSDRKESSEAAEISPTCVFVRLSVAETEETLRATFGVFGAIKHVDVRKNRFGRDDEHTTCIEFNEQTGAAAALAARSMVLPAQPHPVDIEPFRLRNHLGKQSKASKMRRRGTPSAEARPKEALAGTRVFLTDNASTKRPPVKSGAGSKAKQMQQSRSRQKPAKNAPRVVLLDSDDESNRNSTEHTESEGRVRKANGGSGGGGGGSSSSSRVPAAGIKHSDRSRAGESQGKQRKGSKAGDGDAAAMNKSVAAPATYTPAKHAFESPAEECGNAQRNSPETVVKAAGGRVPRKTGETERRRRKGGKQKAVADESLCARISISVGAADEPRRLVSIDNNSGGSNQRIRHRGGKTRGDRRANDQIDSARKENHPQRKTGDKAAGQRSSVSEDLASDTSSNWSAWTATTSKTRVVLGDDGLLEQSLNDDVPSGPNPTQRSEAGLGSGQGGRAGNRRRRAR